MVAGELKKMVGVEIPNIYCKMNYINKLQYNKVFINYAYVTDI